MTVLLARRPRVLMVTPRYFPDLGGIETHVSSIAGRLARNVDLTILTTDAEDRLPAEDRVDGVPVLRVPAWPKGHDARFAPGISRVVGQGWDLVHCQGVHTFVPIHAMAAAQRSATPYIVSLHTGGHPSRLRTAIRRVQWTLIGPLLRSARLVIGVSRFEAAAFERQLGLRNVRVVPNGAGLPAVNRSPAAGPVILSIGRLERYKGHQRAIAALPYVIRRFPDARLEILGSGPFEGDLHRQIQRLGLESRVTIGVVPPADRRAMAERIAASSVVTLLSDYEAHPIAVLEALAVGRPAVVTATSGLAELAGDGLATAVPIDAGPEIIAAALADQIHSPRVPAVRLPTWDDCAAQILDSYSSVLGVPCAS